MPSAPPTFWKTFRKLLAIGTSRRGTELSAAAAIKGAIISARPMPRPSCGITSIGQSDRGSRRPNAINDPPTRRQPATVRAAGAVPVRKPSGQGHSSARVVVLTGFVIFAAENHAIVLSPAVQPEIVVGTASVPERDLRMLGRWMFGRGQRGSDGIG